MWRKSVGGKKKKALVSWDKTIVSKAKGGLGFKAFQKQSLILKMHWCRKLMEEEDLLWIQLEKEFIKRSLDTGPRCQTWRTWTTQGLLLDNGCLVGSPLLRDLAKGLYEGQNSLCFECKGEILPPHLIVEQLLILFNSEYFITP